jgi:hypothetical protein
LNTTRAPEELESFDRVEAQLIVQQVHPGGHVNIVIAAIVVRRTRCPSSVNVTQSGKPSGRASTADNRDVSLDGMQGKAKRHVGGTTFALAAVFPGARRRWSCAPGSPAIAVDGALCWLLTTSYRCDSGLQVGFAILNGDCRVRIVVGRRHCDASAVSTGGVVAVETTSATVSAAG